jgi:hypothetical protein
MVPTAMLFIPAIGLLVLVPFTPESPRWLVLKGRKQEAKDVLDKIRPSKDVQSGATLVEANAMELLIEESKANEDGSWLYLFKGNYLRRTWVSSMAHLMLWSNLLTAIRSLLPCLSSSRPMAVSLCSHTRLHFTSTKALAQCPLPILSLDKYLDF